MSLRRSPWLRPDERTFLLRHCDAAADGAGRYSSNAIARRAGLPRRLVIRALAPLQAPPLGLIVLGGAL
jgi:hypothetical protein